MLGTGFEALDPIRMFHSCYIVLDLQANLKIFARTAEQVRSAIESIENAVLEFRASNSIPLEIRAVHPPDIMTAKKFIRTEDDWEVDNLEQTGILRSFGEVLTPLEKVLWERNRQTIIRQTQMKMQSTMIQALNRVCFYRGKVQIRMQFGCFRVGELGWKTSETARLSLWQFFSDLDRYVPEGHLEQM